MYQSVSKAPNKTEASGKKAERKTRFRVPRYTYNALNDNITY